MDHNPLKTLFHKKSKSQSQSDHPEDESKAALRHPHARAPPPRSSIPHTSDDVAGVPYSDVSQGSEPEVGTLPYKGNAAGARPRSQPSKFPQRKVSTGERSSRAPDGRYGFVGGVGRNPSYSGGTEQARTPPSTRALTSPKPIQTDITKRGSEDATPSSPVPAIPRQYVQDHSQDTRNSPATPREASKLPISEQFSSAAYYTQPGSPQKPEWSSSRSHMPGEYPETINTGNSLQAPSETRMTDRRSDPMAPAEYTFYQQDRLGSSGPSSNHARSRSDVPRNFSRPHQQEVSGPNTATSASSFQSEEAPSPPQSSQGTGYDSAGPRDKSSQTSMLPYRPAAEIQQASEQRLFNGKPLLVEGSPHPIDLRGVVHLGKTQETTVETVTAKPVYHDTVKPTVHHIIEERIDRDIHHHHIHHRILPIIDVQVLPTKHYVPGPDGTLVEIPAPPHYREHITSSHLSSHHQHRNQQDDHFVIAETVSKAPTQAGSKPKGNPHRVYEPRNFTARTFEGTEGDTKHYVTEDGIPRTETTWIHPPRMATDLQEQGKTVPVFFDHDGNSQTPRFRSGDVDAVNNGAQRSDEARGTPAVALHERLGEEAVRLAAERKKAASASQGTATLPTRSGARR